MLTIVLAGLLAAPASLLSVNDPSSTASNKCRKTNDTSIGSTSENKRPRPHSDRAGAVQMLFATFHKCTKYRQIAFPGALLPERDGTF